MLTAGTQDIGYGSMENGKTKAQVIEKAKKEGTTDGLKRALRTFGNVLGLCLNDSDYMAKVSRVKSVPVQFDESRLHRRITGGQAAQHAPPAVKSEPASAGNSGVVSPPEDDSGADVDEFDEYGIFAGGDEVFNELMVEEPSPESVQ